jgi:hypothetical protein
MLKGGAVLQAYNAQVAVDAEAQVIVAVAVTNQAPDQEHLLPMVERVLTNCGRAPEVLSADSGFFSQENVEGCERRGIEAFIAVGRKPEGAPGQSQSEEATPAQEARQRMQEKLRTERGKKLYARRKVIAEPPLGQIKAGQGFRRFSLRGESKVKEEWTLVCLTHNLLKVFRRAAASVMGRGRSLACATGA